jgi:hypothetical protein
MLAREVVGTKTCGSTFRRACSRSFMAYLAKSALLSYGDWARTARAVSRARGRRAKNLLIETIGGRFLAEKCPLGKPFPEGRRRALSGACSFSTK